MVVLVTCLADTTIEERTTSHEKCSRPAILAQTVRTHALQRFLELRSSSFLHDWVHKKPNDLSAGLWLADHFQHSPDMSILLCPWTR